MIDREAAFLIIANESKIILLGGAPARVLGGRGALQDIEQLKTFGVPDLQSPHNWFSRKPKTCACVETGLRDMG